MARQWLRLITFGSYPRRAKKIFEIMWREQTWCGWKLWQVAYSLLFRHPYPSSVSAVLTGTSPPCCLLRDCISCATAARSRGGVHTQDDCQQSAGDQVHSCHLSLTVSLRNRSAVRNGRIPRGAPCPVRSIVFGAASKPDSISDRPCLPRSQIKRALRPAWHDLYSAVALRCNSAGRTRTCNPATTGNILVRVLLTTSAISQRYICNKRAPPRWRRRRPLDEKGE